LLRPLLLCLLPCGVRPVEGEILVDHVERFWPEVGLQSGLDDLSNGVSISLIPALEPTDCGAENPVGLLAFTLLHQLPDDRLLFVESFLDRVQTVVRGCVVEAIVVVGRLLPLLRWRLPEFYPSPSSQESEGFLRLCL